MKRAADAVLALLLAVSALGVMLLALPLMPYFAWKWWREEQEGRTEMLRQMRTARGGHWDHP